MTESRISRTTRPDIRGLFADYLLGVASWRRAKFDDDLRDPRNIRSADGILAIRDFVLALPEDDPRLIELSRVALFGEQFAPGQQTAYAIGLFWFHDQSATLDGFLSHITELAKQDAGEAGKFGGPQVAGDEPW